jgi:predicted acetyltransferase
MELAEPARIYKDSFIGAVREFDTERSVRATQYQQLDLRALEKNFEVFCQEQRGHAEGKHLPDGFVPESVYWLVDGTVFIGRISIRHRLTPQLLQSGGHIGYDIRPTQRRKGYGSVILRLGLERAAALGLERVLLTCDETNDASRKIIEKNGGVLEKSVAVEGGPNKLHFWITL